MPWVLQGCPRCGGDLQYDDLDALWDCVACGWLSVPTALAYPIAAGRHRRRARTADGQVCFDLGGRYERQRDKGKPASR